MHSSPDLLALLALGEDVADPDEHAHIVGCPDCQTQLHEFASAVRAGRRTDVDDVLHSPPPQVWHRITAELGLTLTPRPADGAPVDGAAAGGALVDGHGVRELVRPRPVPAEPLTPADASPAKQAAPGEQAAPAEQTAPGGRRPDRRLTAAAIALAAVLALVVGIGLGANLGSILPGGGEVPTVRLNAMPAYPGSSGQASIEDDGQGHRWLVVRMASPEAATGPREVWLTNTTASPMVSVGFMTAADGRFAIPDDLDLTVFDLVDISQEPTDDTDPRHSGHSMLRGRLPT